MHFVVLVHKLRMLVDKKNHDVLIFFSDRCSVAIYVCIFSDLEESSSDPVSKTTAIVNLKGAVDLLVSPLMLETLQRYCILIHFVSEMQSLCKYCQKFGFPSQVVNDYALLI